MSRGYIGSCLALDDIELLPIIMPECLYAAQEKHFAIVQTLRERKVSVMQAAIRTHIEITTNRIRGV